VATVKMFDADIIRDSEAAGTPIERPDITRKEQGEAPVHPVAVARRSPAQIRPKAPPAIATLALVRPGKTPRPTNEPGA
jgi:hypothetical protein